MVPFGSLWRPGPSHVRADHASAESSRHGRPGGVSFLDLVDPEGLQRGLVTTFGLSGAVVQAIFDEALDRPEFRQLLIVADYE